MSVFSLWRFTCTNNTIEDVKNELNNLRVIQSQVEWDDGPLATRLNDISGFDINSTEHLTMQNTQIEYVFFEGYTERAKKPEYWYDLQGNLREREFRVSISKANMIIFKIGDNLFLITFSGPSKARVLHADLFQNTRLGRPEPANITVTEDMLYWIFKKFINDRDFPLANSHNMYVTGLKSYMGRTRDNNSAIRGEGSRISTILGTLAFLFNNENLKAVRPQLEYDDHVFLLEIKLSGSYQIWKSEYQGAFTQLDDSRKENAIAIYIYTILLPILIECYDENVRTNRWSLQYKRDFIISLGTEIRDRVQNELVTMEAAMETELELLEDDNTDEFDLEIDEE